MLKAKIYSCGGLAMNISSAYTSALKQDVEGVAELSACYIDTSASNLRGQVPKDSLYLVNDLDGSGKLRASNYSRLSECSKEILYQHPPQDLNIVLHSCGGGKILAC